MSGIEKENKQSLLSYMRDAFFREFGGGKPLRVQLDRKQRAERRHLEALLDPLRDASELAPGLAIPEPPVREELRSWHRAATPGVGWTAHAAHRADCTELRPHADQPVDTFRPSGARVCPLRSSRCDLRFAGGPIREGGGGATRARRRDVGPSVEPNAESE